MSVSRVRTRYGDQRFPSRVPIGKSGLIGAEGQDGFMLNVYCPRYGIDSTQSGEYCFDELHKKKHGLYLDGGPLTIRKFTNESIAFEPMHVGVYDWGMYRYRGGFCCNTVPNDIWRDCISLNESVFSDNFEDVQKYGATGWSKARPGQPTADLGLFLAELRDVPKMLRDTAGFFRNTWNAFRSGTGSVTKHAASSWLGANFGWLPFISDLRKFAKTTRDLDRNIQQLRRDNGRWVKRRRVVHQSVDTCLDVKEDGTSYHYPFFNTYAYQDNGLPSLSRRKVIELSASFWFEARFRYYIPDVGSYRWKKKAIRKLYGLNLNPELVWQATPWSWLVDWCSNVGDVISNLDNGLAENLVAKYAYIMGSQRLICSLYSHHNYKPEIGAPTDYDAHFNLILKERQGASPFGFALTGADFSARQWSLLSALGLQRLKFR